MNRGQIATIERNAIASQGSRDRISEAIATLSQGQGRFTMKGVCKQARCSFKTLQKNGDLYQQARQAAIASGATGKTGNPSPLNNLHGAKQ